MKGTTVSARVEYDVKNQAEEIQRQIGAPVPVVIDSLYRQIIFQGGIPFPPHGPKGPKGARRHVGGGVRCHAVPQSRPVGDGRGNALREGL